jgi:hypothetical protein
LSEIAQFNNLIQDLKPAGNLSAQLPGVPMNMRFLVGSVVFLFSGVASAQEGPSFTRDVQPFLQKYCMECHRSGKVKGGLNLESYQSMMKGSKRGRKVVIPGQPDQSRLVRTLEHQMKPYMPPRKSPQPTEKDIALLRSWIKAGAKNDSAKSAFQIRKTEGGPPRIPGNHKEHQEHKGKLILCDLCVLRGSYSYRSASMGSRREAFRAG